MISKACMISTGRFNTTSRKNSVSFVIARSVATKSLGFARDPEPVEGPVLSEVEEQSAGHSRMFLSGIQWIPA